MHLHTLLTCCHLTVTLISQAVKAVKLSRQLSCWHSQAVRTVKLSGQSSCQGNQAVMATKLSWQSSYHTSQPVNQSRQSSSQAVKEVKPFGYSFIKPFPSLADPLRKHGKKVWKILDKPFSTPSKSKKQKKFKNKLFSRCISSHFKPF